MFTRQRLKLPPSLYKCLATTSLIENVGLPRPGYSPKTVSEKLSGDRDLWALATILGRTTETEISQEEVA